MIAASAIEVYLSIVHRALHTKFISKRVVFATVAFIWLASTTIPMGLYMKVAQVVNSLCYVSYNFSSVALATAISNFTLRMVLPLICYVTCYWRIAVFLRARSKVMVMPWSSGGSGKQKASTRAQKNVILTVLYTVILHVLTWTGNQVFFLMAACGSPLNMTSVSQVLQLAVYTSSCVNPFIYIIKYERFRDAAKLTYQRLALCCHARTIHPSSNNTKNFKHSQPVWATGC